MRGSEGLAKGTPAMTAAAPAGPTASNPAELQFAAASAPASHFRIPAESAIKTQIPAESATSIPCSTSASSSPPYRFVRFVRSMITPRIFVEKETATTEKTQFRQNRQPLLLRNLDFRQNRQPPPSATFRHGCRGAACRARRPAWDAPPRLAGVVSPSGQMPAHPAAILPLTARPPTWHTISDRNSRNYPRAEPGQRLWRNGGLASRGSITPEPQYPTWRNVHEHGDRCRYRA